MTSPGPGPAPSPLARAPAAPRTSRAGPGRALAALAAVLLLLAGLLTLALIGVEVGPVALAAGLVLAVLPVPIYVALALFVDRFEPEPPRLLAWAFFWGATGATLIALVVNTAGQAAVGGAFGSAVGQLYGASLSAPVVEEGAKALVLLAIYRWRRSEFDGVLDGIVYAAMVGLGFAFTENILYYGRTALEGGVPLAATFFVRGVLSPFAHPVFTGITGIGVGLAALGTAVWRRLAAVAALLVAIFLHSLWNTSAGLGGGLGFLVVYLLIMVPVFLSIATVAVVALVREGRVVRRHLEPELAAGTLTPEDVATLSSLPARRRALREARRRGREAGRTQKELQHAATELAFLRRHAARRPGHVDRRLEQDAGAYAARLLELRARGALSAATGAEAGHGSAPERGAGADAGHGGALSAETRAGAGRGPGAAATADAPAGTPARSAPAAWYPDPWAQARLRWWDGARWTEHTAA